MAVGQGELIGALSYIGASRETTFGTYATVTAGLEALSFGLRTVQEGKVLEQITGDRVYSCRTKLGKSIEGATDFYFEPSRAACNYILHQALGGSIVSATATGETAGGLGFQHTVSIGDMDNSYTSLSFNVRKGDATNGKVWQYTGVRVNELSVSAEIDDALKMSASLVAKDETQISNDVSAGLSLGACDVLSFVGGRLSIEGSIGAMTSSSFWHVQSANLTISNNLKTDSASRRIGSDTLDILPPGVANIELSCTIRFDTTTAYAAMKNATELAAQFEFLGDTMAGSAVRRGIKFNMPKVFVNDAGDPEIGGPDELLTSEVTFHVLKDRSTSTGYALQAVVTNLVSAYV